MTIEKHPLIMAEFDTNFHKNFYVPLLNAAPVEFFASPKIYMHDPKDEVEPNWMPPDGLSIQIPAVVQNAGFVDNPIMMVTQLVVVLKCQLLSGEFSKFQPHAVIMNDPFRSRRSRQYSRSFIDAVLAYDKALTVHAFRVPITDNNKLSVEATIRGYCNAASAAQE